MIRVLLDENLPRRLKWALDMQLVAEVLTVPERGWGGIKNGPLMTLAASEFDVMITMDRGIAYQQNLIDVDICMVVLRAASNDIDDLIPIIPELNTVLAKVTTGRVIHVGK